MVYVGCVSSVAGIHDSPCDGTHAYRDWASVCTLIYGMKLVTHQLGLSPVQVAKKVSCA